MIRYVLSHKIMFYSYKIMFDHDKIMFYCCKVMFYHEKIMLCCCKVTFYHDKILFYRCKVMFHHDKIIFQLSLHNLSKTTVVLRLFKMLTLNKSFKLHICAVHDVKSHIPSLTLKHVH